MNKRSFLKAITGLLAGLGFGVKVSEAQPRFVHYDGRVYREWVTVPGYAPYAGQPLTFNGTTYTPIRDVDKLKEQLAETAMRLQYAPPKK